MPGIPDSVRRLRRAIERGRLRLEYQPKADMRTGSVVGVEGLVRWDAPRGRVIRPDEFVPRAERNGRTLDMFTGWTLNTALAQAHAWEHGGHELSIAVNLSPLCVLDERLPERIARLLSRWDVPPRLLQLELTETAVFGAGKPERVEANLRALSDLGLVLALDDFGTGYSSLTHLRELPINAIKVDKSFVLRMDERPNDAVIVRSVIALAKNLGLRVVAEGVEREPVWRRLSDLGCDVAQGNYLAPSLPPDELIAWVRQWEELYEEAHRMADELLERRLGPPDRRSGTDRREQPRGRRFVPRSERSAAPTLSLPDLEP